MSDCHAPVAQVPEGCRVYAIGDIHGRADLLDALLSRIVMDARCHPARRRVLITLGDYVDRGPDSRLVIERLLAPPAGFELVCLRGNHEDLMLGFLQDPDLADLWLANGGTATLTSYGLPEIRPPMRPAQAAALRVALRETLPDSHRGFLDGLTLSHVVGDYMFVHAGVDPRRPLDRQDPQDLTWIREIFLDHNRPLDKLIVHGHTIAPQPVVAPHRIGIDTGAWRSGHLTALVLSGPDRAFLMT